MEKADKNKYQRRSVHSEMEKLDVGGLLKNEDAAWVRGYMISLGTCPVEAALGNPDTLESYKNRIASCLCNISKEWANQALSLMPSS